MLDKIRYICEKSSRTWYVVFESRRGEFRFWHLFTKKNFDHVWAFTPLEYSTLIVVSNPSECLLEEWPVKAEAALQYVSPAATKILKFQADYQAFKPYVPRGIINCVVLIKCFLGVRGFSLTPLGLYKQLKKLGAIDVK